MVVRMSPPETGSTPAVGRVSLSGSTSEVVDPISRSRGSMVGLPTAGCRSPVTALPLRSSRAGWIET